MKKWGTADKLGRTVLGLIIMHPILVFRSGKVFLADLRAEYGVAFNDLKRMWRRSR